MTTPRSTQLAAIPTVPFATEGDYWVNGADPDGHNNLQRLLENVGTITIGTVDEARRLNGTLSSMEPRGQLANRIEFILRKAYVLALAAALPLADEPNVRRYGLRWRDFATRHLDLAASAFATNVDGPAEFTSQIARVEALAEALTGTPLAEKAWRTVVTAVDQYLTTVGRPGPDVVRLTAPVRQRAMARVLAVAEFGHQMDGQ